MPKKTKRAKIGTQKRRVASVDSPRVDSYEPVNMEAVKGEFSFRLNKLYRVPLAEGLLKKSEKSLLVRRVSFVKADFLRSFVLVVLIFSLEIVIYFAWFKNQT